MSPGTWRVLLARAAEKEAKDPRAGGLVKLKGRPGLRLRVGDWRVLVELDAASHTIRIKRVLPRGRVYER